MGWSDIALCVEFGVLVKSTQQDFLSFSIFRIDKCNANIVSAALTQATLILILTPTLILILILTPTRIPVLVLVLVLVLTRVPVLDLTRIPVLDPTPAIPGHHALSTVSIAFSLLDCNHVCAFSAIATATATDHRKDCAFNIQDHVRIKRSYQTSCLKFITYIFPLKFMKAKLSYESTSFERTVTEVASKHARTAIICESVAWWFCLGFILVNFLIHTPDLCMLV